MIKDVELIMPIPEEGTMGWMASVGIRCIFHLHIEDPFAAIEFIPPDNSMSRTIHLQDSLNGGFEVDLPDQWDDEVKDTIDRFAQNVVRPAYVEWLAKGPRMEQSAGPMLLKMTIPEEL